MSRGKQSTVTMYDLYKDMIDCEKVFWSRCRLNSDGTRTTQPRHIPPETTLDGQAMLINGATRLSEEESEEMRGRRLGQSTKTTGHDHLRARKTRDATEKERVKPKVISR